MNPILLIFAIIFVFMFSCIIYALRNKSSGNYYTILYDDTLMQTLQTTKENIQNKTTEYVTEVLPESIITKIVDNTQSDRKNKDAQKMLIPTKQNINNDSLPWDCLIVPNQQKGFDEFDLYKRVYSDNPKIIIY